MPQKTTCEPRAERHTAMLAGDTDVVDRLTADEYVQRDIFGHVQDKSAWMSEYLRPLAELTKNGKFRWEVRRQVRTFGDTAIVVGSLMMKGTGARFIGHTWEEAPQTTIEGKLRFTRVWIKTDGKWLLAALHNAGLSGDAKRRH